MGAQEALFENPSAAVCVSDSERRFVRVNAAFEHLFGYRADELVGRGAEMIYADSAIASRVGHERLRTDTALTAEPTVTRYRRKDGSEFFGTTIIVPVSVADGELSGVVGIINDCTEQQRREDVLRALYAITSDRGVEPALKMRQILALGCEYFEMPLGIVSCIEGEAYTVIDAECPNGEIQPGARFDLRGTYCRETMRSKVPVGHHHAGNETPLHPCYMDTGLESYLGARIYSAGGLFGTINFSSPDARDRPFGENDFDMIQMFADWATQQISIDRSLHHLERARCRAEEASIAKSRFLANMSHEIRTPMTGVLGYADVLRRTALDADQQRAVERILSAGRTLLGILNDILDLSRLEAGRMEAEREPFALRDAVEDCASLMRSAAEAKGIALEAWVDPALPEAIVGDALRVRQIVLNLLGNAIKFTEVGSVTLACRRVGAGKGSRLVFEVADTGIGIPPERIHEVLRDFVQADSSTQRRFGGTGLGLSISTKLAALMNGTLTLESAPARGTTACLTLPLVPAEPPNPDPSEDTMPERGTTRSRGRSLLLVEDVEFNRDMFQMMLEGSGFAVTAVADGREAIDAARERRFDAVLMDVQMPGIDGCAATRTIRSLPGWERVPILALTAGAFPDEVAACRAAGMDDHIAKPTTADELTARVMGWIARADEARDDMRAGEGRADALSGLLADVPDAMRRPLLAKFRAMIDEAARAMRDLRDAVGSRTEATGDVLERIAALAHRVKGAASMVGLASLAMDAERAEATARRGTADPEPYAPFTAALSGLADAFAARTA